ncbi:MAG: 50S ribosomal protein L21 [Myxococcales bacterium]|nr:MAG: 50S ribosomal protein L21 [Myxococcales bacterium]
MYAVVKTGGKQYKVAEGDVVRVEKLAGDEGQSVKLDKVLLVNTAEGPKVGRPYLENAVVDAQIVRQALGEKIAVFHKKRRKGYEKKTGHRQRYTDLKITAIKA